MLVTGSAVGANRQVPYKTIAPVPAPARKVIQFVAEPRPPGATVAGPVLQELLEISRPELSSYF